VSNAKRERARFAAVVAFALTVAAYAQEHRGPDVTFTEFMIGQIMMPSVGPASSSVAMASCRIVQLLGRSAPMRCVGPASEMAPLVSCRWEPSQWLERKH
jgi:hypothetical protein